MVEKCSNEVFVHWEREMKIFEGRRALCYLSEAVRVSVWGLDKCLSPLKSDIVLGFSLERDKNTCLICSRLRV